MGRLDRARAEWERNPSARRFDLYVLPVLTAIFIGGFIVAIASSKYHVVGQMTALASAVVSLALNYSIRRPRKDR